MSNELILLRNAPFVQTGITELGIYLASQLNMSVDLCIVSSLNCVQDTLKYSNISFNKLKKTDLLLPKLDGNNNSYDNLLYKKIETDEDFEKRINSLKKYIDKKKEKYARILLLTHECVLYSLSGYYFRHCNYLTL